jgi:hypothetical protein
MKKINIKQALTSAEIASFIILIANKLDLEFEDEEIPDNIKQYFK